MDIDGTVSRVSLTLVKAVIHYVAYRLVIFFLFLAKDAIIKYLKTIFKPVNKKRSVGTSSTEPCLANEDHQ